MDEVINIPVVIFQPCPPHQWAHATTCGYFECIRCREKINYDDPRYNAMAGLDRIKDQSHEL